MEFAIIMPVAVYRMLQQTKEISPIMIGTANPSNKRCSFRYGYQKKAAKARVQTDIYSTITGTRIWWSQTGSNRRPPACKAGALPAELWPHKICRVRRHARCLARENRPREPVRAVLSANGPPRSTLFLALGPRDRPAMNNGRRGTPYRPSLGGNLYGLQNCIRRGCR